MKQQDSVIPSGATITTVHHQVAFHETDAMGIVHHSKYFLFFEDARVAWLTEHDRPYTDYMDIGRNFAVTSIEAKYHHSSSFSHQLEISAALHWVHGASARFIYEIICQGTMIVSGATEHALVDHLGRPRRIPKEWRAVLLSKAIEKEEARS